MGNCCGGAEIEGGEDVHEKEEDKREEKYGKFMYSFLIFYHFNNLIGIKRSMKLTISVNVLKRPIRDSIMKKKGFTSYPN